MWAKIVGVKMLLKYELNTKIDVFINEKCLEFIERLAQRISDGIEIIDVEWPKSCSRQQHPHLGDPQIYK